MKKCTNCKKEKDLSEFYTDKKSKDGFRYNCKSCGSKAHTDNRKHRSKLARNNKLKRMYGITQQDFITMLEEQKSKCKICGINSLEELGTILYVDHCHTTGKVRGLLCQKCNTGLGYFKDDTEILKKATKYLEDSQ